MTIKPWAISNNWQTNLQHKQVVPNDNERTSIDDTEGGRREKEIKKTEAEKLHYFIKMGKYLPFISDVWVLLRNVSNENRSNRE